MFVQHEVVAAEVSLSLQDAKALLKLAGVPWLMLTGKEDMACDELTSRVVKLGRGRAGVAWPVKDYKAKNPDPRERLYAHRKFLLSRPVRCHDGRPRGSNVKDPGDLRLLALTDRRRSTVKKSPLLG